MLPRDIGLFWTSARTDAMITRLCRAEGARVAFEAAYERSADPWASAALGYRYQRLKYDKLVALLPRGRFARVLDLGCGLGLLTQKLAKRSGHVLGLDISTAAVERARVRAAKLDNLQFEQGDITDLPTSLDGRFDLAGAPGPVHRTHIAQLVVWPLLLSGGRFVIARNSTSARRAPRFQV
jgi:SAM-dependent methyltransferase